jgi:hypothetical protein
MYPVESNPPRSYSQEDVQGILHLAIARQVDRGEITRQQLLEIAEELAIEVKDLEAAEQDWQESKLVLGKRQEFALFRREKFRERGIRYAIVNGFFLTINLISAGTISWAIYLALLMGIPLALSAWKTFLQKGPAYERDFQRWKLQQEMKESFSSLWTRIRNFTSSGFLTKNISQ